MGDSLLNNPEFKALTDSVADLRQMLTTYIQTQSQSHATAQPSTSTMQTVADNLGPEAIEDPATQSRYTKLDFPQFTGKEDPLIWLHRCDLYFQTTRTPHREKVGLAAFNMTGEAQL